jgi:hypothetical protein
MINKKIKNNILLIVVVQVFLLVNMILANSYLIHQTNPLIEDLKIINKKKNNFKNLINFGINLLIGVLTIKQIGIVSATELTTKEYCCPNTCNLILLVNGELQGDCGNEVVPIPTSCDNTAGCEKGCCFDSVGGLCSTNSPKGTCTDDGGKWYDDTSCNINVCKKGCCVLGSEAPFMTEQQCEDNSLSLGFEKDWRDAGTLGEFTCSIITASMNEGACIEEGVCRFTTEKSCIEGNINGAYYFYEGYLCTHPDLNQDNKCEKQHHIDCVEGKDEIYWFDSCGNKENIYSANKDASWNNGMVLKKHESCNINPGNINSGICGNCNVFLSSRCSETESGKGVDDGDFICKNLGCENAQANVGKQDRANTETWCLYDGYIGDGKDTVGSEHWLAQCLDGELSTTRCGGSYRTKICQENIITEGEKERSQAGCVINEEEICLSYNDNDTMEEKCNENTHCMIKNINIDKYFKFSFCVPKYPLGFDLSQPSASCGNANLNCVVHYERKVSTKKPGGYWSCKENCDCDTNEFAKKMNELCISLGDCGSYVNYVGEGTDNTIPKYSWINYKNNAKPVAGQYIESQNTDNLLSSIIKSIDPKSDEENGFLKRLKVLGTITGASGLLIWKYVSSGALINIASKIGLYGVTESTMAVISETQTTGTMTIGITSIAPYAAAAVGAIIGATAGTYLANSMGISGDGAIAITIAGGAAGGATAYMLTTGISTGGLIVLGGAVLVGSYVAFTGLGKTKKKTIKFTCMPWTAPIFSTEAEEKENCKKCNENPLRPCTRYRCESLGQACKILNEGEEENPSCESIPYETNPPIITAKEVITENYEFTSNDFINKRIEIKSTEGEICIAEYTSISFKLTTDEHAQCIYSFEHTNNYEEMEEPELVNYPIEQTLFTENHIFEFNFPNIEISVIDNLQEDEEGKRGDMNMYIRCKDVHGYSNIDEYVVKFCVHSGPDMTAAWITGYSPNDGSFLEHGITETSATIYLNEPADCNYDVVADKSYDEMVNTMSCGIDSFGRSQCSTTLTNLVNGENKFYIKCKDKPWLIEGSQEYEEYKEKYKNEPEYLVKNINTNDFVYTLHVSEHELKIDSIKIIYDNEIISSNGIIKSGFEPISVDLKVQTSGGVDNGVSECSYKWGNNWIQLQNTFSNSHKQSGLNLMGGNFEIPIMCVDETGNTADGNVIFTISIDSSPPEVVRVYNEGGMLKLITNEEAECYYDFNRCRFNTDNKMTTAGYSTKHSAEWIIGQTYYIKCEDIWGNSNSNCAIKVRPSDFI